MAAPRPNRSERRNYWTAAVALFGILAVLVIATTLVSQADDAGTATSTPEASRDGAGEAGQDIIPRPNRGRTPRSPGDRGGWEQLATLAAILAGISLLVALVWRSGRRARAGLEPPATPSAERQL